ncbi:Ig-like domain-containing protein [Haloferula sp. A504]|uniref:Ig-like domain-containing protein n=1 Tax=Haloferula sp. A504 TaxID=3373601 RepID=UPI0031C1DE36|nr:Ig-like domain-containing protein [Verrucomicrobiaceae bacterium E54]
MKNPLTLLATALVCMTSGHGQSILLGGFDGTQTQNTIAPATVTSSTGVRELKEGFVQDIGAVGAVAARIWTDQATGKELQWGARTNSSNTLWGLSTFDAAPASGTANPYVATFRLSATSHINYEITNTGTQDVILDTLHFNHKRADINDGGDTITISLEQNGTFANPPILSASPLTSVGSVNVSLDATTNWVGYEVDLSLVSSTTLASGETATYRIAVPNWSGDNYMDNIAISGIVGSITGGTVDADTSTVSASPTTVLADGSATSTIAVTLKDSGGLPVPSEDVTLSSSGPGTPTISPSATLTTNASGIALFTVSSNTVGTEVFTATSSTDSIVVTQTASVDFQSTLVDAGNSTVSASPSAVLADDTETSTITVTLRNAGGQLLPGKLVSLSGDGSASIAPATDTTDASGLATFTVKSGTVGTENFTATSESVSVTQTADVAFQDVATTSILLAGFDGHNTYEIPDGSGGFTSGGTFQSEGDKYIRDPHQRTAAATAGFTAELYMFSNVAKEPQWGGAGQFSLGYWGTGSTVLATLPNTDDGRNVFTVADTTTTEFRVQNTGSGDITLEKIHFSVQLDSGAGVDMTVAYASGDLTAAGGGSTVVTYTANANTGYDVDLTSILSDNVLGAGESAVFTLVSGAGTGRMRIDDIAISGTVGSGGGGGTSYATWSGGAPANGDANGDGVANAVAYALGAADVNENAISLLPTFAYDNSGSPIYLVFTFNRDDAAEADSTTEISVEYGSDLAGWTTAVDSVDGVVITETGSDPTNVQVKIPASLAVGGKLFARLKVTVTP